MILIDLLHKYIRATKQLNFDADDTDEFSCQEVKETRELITLLTLNNIWTVEDLKNKLK